MRTFKRKLMLFVTWIAALILWIWRNTCRYRVVNDCRPELRTQSRPFTIAALHAHQIPGIFFNDERPIVAMVSRSADGELIIPLLKLLHVKAVRGSSRTATRDKGGRQALEELIMHAQNGLPTLIAVDGPRGPRGHVHRGVIELSRRANSVILPVMMHSTRRFILSKTWDRMQFPLPFSKITMYVGQPIDPLIEPDEKIMRQKLTDALRELEQTNDKEEAARW